MPALAQPPSYPASPYPPPSGYQPGGAGGQPGQLPLPPGYRPRTPPAAQRPAPAVPPEGGGGGGQVMYFSKPADALTATGGAAAGAAPDGVAQRGAGQPALLPVPDAVLPPPPPASRYRPIESPDVPSLAVPVAGPRPTAYTQPPDQPPPGGADQPPKLEEPMPPKRGVVPPSPGGAKDTQLPTRQQIFTVYNDLELEKAIIDSVIDAQLEQRKRDNPNYTGTREQLIKDLDPQTLRFPALPVLSPPGVAYQPKTLKYEPRTLTVEPLYVVHRRLYFEEKNGERAGWDLGPFSLLTSATRFYVNTLLFPAHVANGVTNGFWDTSAGKCLPGSPTPYYLYPPELTLQGSVFQAGVVTGFAFLLP